VPTLACRSSWSNLMADEERSKRGRRANNAGKQFERDCALVLPNGKRVGMYGGIVDVTARGSEHGVVAQCKLGGSFPSVLNRYLERVSAAAKADEIPVVIVGDRPGPGSKRTTLVLLSIEDFIEVLG